MLLTASIALPMSPSFCPALPDSKVVVIRVGEDEW